MKDVIVELTSFVPTSQGMIIPTRSLRVFPWSSVAETASEIVTIKLGTAYQVMCSRTTVIQTLNHYQKNLYHPQTLKILCLHLIVLNAMAYTSYIWMREACYQKLMKFDSWQKTQMLQASVWQRPGWMTQSHMEKSISFYIDEIVLDMGVECEFSYVRTYPAILGPIWAQMI